MDISKSLIKFKEDNKLTDEELAGLLGVSLRSIINYKRGENASNSIVSRFEKIIKAPLEDIKSFGSPKYDFQDLERFRIKHGLTKADISRTIGISGTVYYNYLNGIRSTPDMVLRKVEQILNGELRVKRKNRYIDLETPNSNLSKIPCYDVDFTGGYDLIINDSSIKPSHYIYDNDFSDADFVANLSGNSMSPTLMHGEKVAFKHIENWYSFIEFGKIYGIVTENFRLIKRIERGIDDNTLTLVSDNEEYSNQIIEKKLITSLFIVLGRVGQRF